MRKAKPKKYTVFFDFDNTITTYDSLDGIIARFSQNNRWLELEERWKSGEIGSRECLSGQIKGVRITKAKLDDYLSGVKIDPYFKRLVDFLNAKNISTFILSDNFDYILKRVLTDNSINSLKVYSNRLRFAKDRLIPHFPFHDKRCPSCAHCKTKNLLENAEKDSIIVYIGDGHSDTCPAKYADIVFAKEDLLSHYKDKNLSCRPYKGLKEVYDYLRGVIYE